MFENIHLPKREFLKWLCRISGGYFVISLAPPLWRVNTTLFSEANAACQNPMLCGAQDCCTLQDNCGAGDTTGHTCSQKDICDSDSSKDCTNDECVSDSSGTCNNDTCKGDSSGGCENDNCSSDSSGSCKSDSCESDSSGACENDNCTSDSSGGGINDKCLSDASGDCEDDRCISDKSGPCKIDVCILDLSSSCERDLCREDKSPDIPGVDIDCTNDTCSLDLALNHDISRRHLAKAGINQAIKWLYKLSTIILFITIASGASHAATVIDSRNAVFLPTPTYITSQAVSVPSPVGPFLRDCDNDGILEADINGDGQCLGDPKVLDYNSDGTRELPLGTPFSGSYQFTCFYIPSDVSIVATGPLTMKASQEVAIFGAMKLSSGAEISSPGMIDLRTSAWLSETGNITFITALVGEVDETPTSFGDTVPPIAYTSICPQQQLEPALAVPTLTEWGLIMLIAIMGMLSVYYLRTRRIAR